MQRVDAASLAVEQTFASPNAEQPGLGLKGAVGDDVLAVSAGDTPETADQQVVFRIATATGAVVQRFPVPQTNDTTLDTAAGGDAVAVAAFQGDSASGVFVFDADDAELRWSAVTPRGAYSPAVGRSIAVVGDRLLVGVPSADPAQPRGRVLVFSLATGAPMDELEAPEVGIGFDFFGRAIAAAGNLVAIGAPGLGEEPTPGRAFVYDAQDLQLVDTLSAASEIPMGDAVAIAGDVIVVGGNENDGVVHVFEPGFPTTTTTSSTIFLPTTSTTTLPPCASGCDDGDACTVDACVDGGCVSTPEPGFPGTRCRLDALRQQTSCAPARAARRLDADLRRLAALAAKAAQGPSASSTRAARRFLGRLDAYCRRVERLRTHERVSPACADSLTTECRSTS